MPEVAPARRSRRRKAPTTLEKENADGAVSRKPRSRKPRKNDLVLKDCDENFDLSLRKDPALAKFEANAENLSSFWQRHATLAEHIVRASQSLSPKSTSSLLSEEHASEIFSTCRSHVKDATENKNSEETLKMLYVAIHGLRAIGPTFCESKKMEATIKILYHAITTASDVSLKTNDLGVCVDATSQCLAAFQALGCLLHEYKLDQSSTSHIAFKYQTTRTNLFPLPLLVEEKNRSSTLSVKQVFKIAMQATTSVVTSLVQIYALCLGRGKLERLSIDDFGPYVSDILQHTLIEPQSGYATTLRFVQEVTVPWSCLLSSNELATYESMEDSLTYAKRAFRVLFDTASQFDKYISKSQKVSPADSLEIRKQAILAFLLSGPRSELSLKMKSAIKQHHWEAACAYACKASMAYRQHLLNDKCAEYDGFLDAFHNEVGHALDSLGSDAALAYVEYAAYRALHTNPEIVKTMQCKRKDCIFGQLGYLFKHNECISSMDNFVSSELNLDVAHALLSVFFLVLRAQKDLDLPQICGIHHGCDDLERLSTDHVIARFQSVFFDATRPLPRDIMNTCYKLFEMLGLNRKVYQVLSKGSKRPISRVTLTALDIVGRVLSKCIGPLAVSLVKYAENIRQPLCEVAADSYVRALAVFDRVREWQLRIDAGIEGENIGRTDDTIRELFSLCDGSEPGMRPSEDSIEKSAKTIFAIGRTRYDSKEYHEALMPLCFGAELFSRLAEIRGLHSINGLQLSTRYSHLSLALSSLDMTNEGCLALVVAIVYDITAAIDDEKEHSPVQLFRHLSGLTNGAVYMGSSPRAHGPRNNLVGRLVRLYGDQILTQPTGEPTLQFSSEGTDVKGMLRASVGVAMNDEKSAVSAKVEGQRTDLSLAGLIWLAFKDRKLMLGVQQAQMSALRREQLVTVAGMLAEHGFLLQQRTLAESRMEAIYVQDFKRLFQLLESLTKTVFRDDPMIEVSYGLIRILAATSLVSFVVSEKINKPNADGYDDSIKEEKAIRSEARRLIIKANEGLNSALGSLTEGQHRLMSNALLGCALLFSSESLSHDRTILTASDKHSLVCACKEAVQLITEKDTMNPYAKDSFRICLTRTLTRFQDIVNLEGDKLLAAQAALLILRLNEQTGNGDESWYRATASNLLQDGGLRFAAKTIVCGKEPCDPYLTIRPTLRLEDLIKIEIVLSRLRLEMHTFERDVFESALSKARKLYSECTGNVGGDETDHATELLLYWIYSSCAMTLAAGFECRGAPSSAIYYLRQGLSICRRSVSTLKQLQSTLDFFRDGAVCLDEWRKTSLSTFHHRLTERRIAGQQRLSIAYSQIGDHRRSEAYALGAAARCMLGVCLESKKQRFKIDDLASIDTTSIRVVYQSVSYRLLWEMKAKASPLDTVRGFLRDSLALEAFPAEQYSQDIDRITWDIDTAWNLLKAGDLHYSLTFSPDAQFRKYYEAASSKIETLISSREAARLLGDVSARFYDTSMTQAFASLQYAAKLRRVRCLIAGKSESDNTMVQQLCTGIVETTKASAQCRAWAHYYLGLMFTRTARQTGALLRLWNDDAVGISRMIHPEDRRDGRHAVAMARTHLRQALPLVGPSSDALSRDIMRTLALVTGPSLVDEDPALSAPALIHSSLGATSRQVVSSVMENGGRRDDALDAAPPFCDDPDFLCGDERLLHVFDALDTSFINPKLRNERIKFLFAETGKTLPSNWRVVAVALCPTGEILLTSLAAQQDKSSTPEIDTVCIFPDAGSDALLDSTAYDDLMKPLDALIRRNEDQISGLDVAAVSDNFSEETAKRDWWNDRQRADDELQDLVENAETKYFSSELAKRIFVGSAFDDEDDVSMSVGNLASKFEEACTIDEDTKQKSEPRDSEDLSSHSTTSSDENCLLLVLDENLQRFPFEGMGMLSNCAVSRVPSLPFVLAPLLECKSECDKDDDPCPLTNPTGASCIVDPEGNLSQTKDRIAHAIGELCSANGWNWEAVIGTNPSEDFVQTALTREKGFLLYCGHGGATACFSQSQVERLMTGVNDKGKKRACRSTIILMGCSSGKLVAVNRKDSKTTDRVTLFYEPEGIALSYLCAGAPCVVGNLWDVTDRDIDRYCIDLLGKFLGDNQGRSLPKCVAEARSSCKMRHIVGLAPVCYGVPVHLAKR